MNQTVQSILDQTNRRPENESLRLFTALGASEMVYSDNDNFIQFKVKGDRDVNKVKVIYDAVQDLYNVEFYKQRGLKCDLKDTISGLYDDSLVNAIWRRVVEV